MLELVFPFSFFRSSILTYPFPLASTFNTFVHEVLKILYSREALYISLVLAMEDGEA